MKVDAPSPAPDESAGADESQALLRVLLVDDHEDTAEILRMLLSRRGFDVTVARSVASGMEAGGSHFDVLLCDLDLPDGSGHELLRRLRSLRAFPAIAVSGRESRPREEAEATFDTYLAKPVPIDAVVRALRTACVAFGTALANT